MDIVNKTVLVCEDDPKHSNELLRFFDKYNKRSDRLFHFSTVVAPTKDEVAEKLKGLNRWDVVTIDRRFQEKGKPPQILSRLILRALNDLQPDSVWVVFTAFPSVTNRYPNETLIECMRLGAWDYIDKNVPRAVGGSSYQDVVDSVVACLREKNDRDQRKRLDKDAVLWIRGHGEDLMRYPDKFVPLKRESGGKWEIVESAVHSTLFGVYGELDSLREDTNRIHITWVDASKGGR